MGRLNDAIDPSNTENKLYTLYINMDIPHKFNITMKPGT